MSTTVKIHFLGAAGTVTGSKFLIETPNYNILIDCGMFQGLKKLRKLNWEPFPFPPENIDLVLLTHGHLDHTAYLPKLVLQGYNNPVRATAPTLAIATIIIMDSAKIQEEYAENANEEGYTIHDPALPIYNVEDAKRTIGYFESAEIDTWYTATKDIRYRFIMNGHIIGSTFIELDIFGKRFVFSGDIGRKNDALLEAPKKPESADFIFMESTYGNKLHAEDDADNILIDAIKNTIQKRGNLIIPSFAVERLQTLMYKLWQLYKKNLIPNIPIFVDSPMGNEVLEVFEAFSSWHKLSLSEYKAMKHHFNIITSYRDTWNTIDDPRPKVVIAGSGMVTGGRVLTYLRYALEEPENTVLLVGYQAEGTRGRQLQEGQHEIKIAGKYYKVKAIVRQIESLSAHADQQELLSWLSNIQNTPQKIFLIHGEEMARDTLRVKIKDTYNWPVYLPHLNEVVNLKF
ncbi:MBL fold metallo-hydrolase [Gillisia sp. M10.2A]|uniref:MBL fold metallo-hydrolase n=1 Tax=Gillisia lutea TaxID=2909668 RepID=A0ABS9EK57_9FLAO|nr:MBL fold metallo-hydrolase [Gillisia lutea]MCF4102712.1 MBL fold metallo-hydrolase [Gillisia lutea]